jgi:hypothetical protein
MADEIRRAAKKRLLFLPHAVRQMARSDRMIRTAEVRATIDEENVIEEYPDDPRGPSALLLGRGEAGRAIHVVVAPKSDYLAIITAYVPDPDQWEDAYAVRKKES